MSEQSPGVTDELLTSMPDHSWEKENAKHQRQMHRYTALNHAVQLEAARQLTEEPETITQRILSRADEFYNYLSKDAE